MIGIAYAAPSFSRHRGKIGVHGVIVVEDQVGDASKIESDNEQPNKTSAR